MASDIYLKVGELFAKWFKMRIAASLVALEKKPGVPDSASGRGTPGAAVEVPAQQSPLGAEEE
jgi:hypothetical protein